MLDRSDHSLETSSHKTHQFFGILPTVWDKSFFTCGLGNPLIGVTSPEPTRPTLNSHPPPPLHQMSPIPAEKRYDAELFMPPQLVAAHVSCPHRFPSYEVVVNTLWRLWRVSVLHTTSMLVDVVHTISPVQVSMHNGPVWGHS